MILALALTDTCARLTYRRSTIDIPTHRRPTWQWRRESPPSASPPRDPRRAEVGLKKRNAPDWHLDYRSTASRTTQSRPLGIAAMQQLVQTFKVIDNFRQLNLLRREYTRTHARPAITRAAHIWPDQTDRAALKRGGLELQME